MRNSSLNSDAGEGSWSQAALQLICLALVVALALLTLGPMFDHHFAERHPGHHHLYLGPAPDEHDHGFAQYHTHRALWLTTSAALEADGPEEAGAVYFSPSDGTAARAVHLTLPLFAPSLILYGDDARILPTTSATSAVLSGTTIAPPKRPPRA